MPLVVVLKTPMKRRHFLSTTLAAAGGVSPVWVTGENVYTPPEEDTVWISILHTTDLHGHLTPTKTYDGVENVGGFARCLTQIRKWRKSNPNHLLLDIGDLYQGTHVSLESEGDIMIDLLNAANYDAWVAGNHDFDWGEKVFRNAVENSSMPVLSSNLSVDGHRAGHEHHGKSSPYSNLHPQILKEVGGIKIGIFGITTPGLPFWLNPQQLGSIKALDPLAEAKAAISNLKARGADCIIAAGHMGLKRYDIDDYANQVNRVLLGCPEIDVYIAGHTHRDRPSTVIGNTVFTQAGYHGIWSGRVNLTFRKDDRKLIRRNAEVVLMDEEIADDPLVFQVAGDAIEQSEEALAKNVGRLQTELKSGYKYDTGADIQSLIAAGIVDALNKRGQKLDGVLHGAFSRDPVAPGEKTLADLWEIIPYENRIVSASVTGEQLRGIVEEAFANFGNPRLVGFKVETHRVDRKKKIAAITDRDGMPVTKEKKYRIAFNSYDAQSGGRKLPFLRETLLKPAAETVYHPVDTRAALTDYFLDEETVDSDKIEALTGA